jgi:hypothetical protein
MNRRLIALNITLALAAVYGGTQLWRQQQAAKLRAEKLRQSRVTPAPAPPFVPLPNEPPVQAARYPDVAMQTLFHPSRNPNIEKPLPPPLPPPRPMPALPLYYGQMNIGDGPLALLAEQGGKPQKAVKAGEAIGPFTLEDLNTVDITFKWTETGEIARRTLSSMLQQTPRLAVQPMGGSSSAARPNGAPPPPPPPPAPKSAIGPVGDVSQYGTKQCDPNDNMPAGSVVAGFRKTLRQTPMSTVCFWEKVN